MHDTGDRMTFEEYAVGSMPRLLGMATAICVQAALAEDLLQNVLIKVHAKWDTVAPESRDAYVRRALVNELISWKRKWIRQIPTETVEPAWSGQLDPSVDVVERDAMLALIGRLPPRQRAVLALRYYADLSDEQIAQDLGCSPGTVRAHASRALATLRITTRDQLARTEN